VCELLGISFDEPVSADVSIRAFGLRDVENADGWGLAWYEDHSLAIVKEPLRWTQSRFSRFLQEYEYLQSSLFIGHVRHATTGGGVKRADTHPFARELMGRNYCFAHNGTVRGAYDQLKLGRFRPIGDTDSEHVFCHVLDLIALRDAHLQRERDWRWLHELFCRINQMGKFNCLMCDGERLFCYRDRAWTKGLMMNSVPLKHGEADHLSDPSMAVELEAEQVSRGIIVATRALSEEVWHPLRKGELLVLEEGQIAYSSARRRRVGAGVRQRIGVGAGSNGET
jgi:glutamine amidotransferase